MPANNMLESVPFRFLDLPKELRFMVYENLNISMKQLRLVLLEEGLQVEQQITPTCSDQPAITVTLQTIPVQIFTTCHTVYSEALPFLTRKLDKIRETSPRISVDSDCLYTNTRENTQTLLRSVLDDLNQHPFFQSKPGTVNLQLNGEDARRQYPQEVHRWLSQTTHLLLSQRPLPCPFSGFMGTRTYPTVRLIIEVPKAWKYTAYCGVAVGPLMHVGTPPLFTASVATQLMEIWNDLAGYTERQKHVKSGAIVFGQDDERINTKDGLVVKKTVAMDFGLCRACD
ncbi:uncharacterized protein M421DRAFT_201918 [Didymella exigua CBS 183.55]|uniref:F-box domain-containing protein n=1 Tax=Didymella exigua CBS 183.55 TaxID=1150837 RepID=A0A6A5S1I6_9PLEO|nr:uncharacterized protein M421DRAFT_201918 [Didymella exigua CBS 183.55]KAF1933649.1 hypothetical protein M421DRAFT_201918 [Didymella exigua CBS 183.55]